MDLKLKLPEILMIHWLWFKTCIVGISLTTLKFYRKKKSIENVIDEFDKVTEMTRDIKVSIDKVKIEYPII
jgi:hypothetical protein